MRYGVKHHGLQISCLVLLVSFFLGHFCGSPSTTGLLTSNTFKSSQHVIRNDTLNDFLCLATFESGADYLILFPTDLLHVASSHLQASTPTHSVHNSDLY